MRILTRYIFIFFLTANFIAYSKTRNQDQFPVNNIRFTENKGQVSDQYYRSRPDVFFSGRSGNMVFHLRDKGISYQFFKVDSWRLIDSSTSRKLIKLIPGDSVADVLSSYRLDINWLGANSNIKIDKVNEYVETENFYSNVCPGGVTNVKSFSQVIYRNIYKGIDLKWYEKNGILKYDFIVDNGADHNLIQFEINGSQSIHINKRGELEIETPYGTIIEGKPLVFQDGRKLEANWKVSASTVSYEVKGRDTSKPMVIDPMVRLWGSLYGGNMNDAAWYVVADANGNTYITGDTQSSNNIATVGAHLVTYGGSGDAFLTKFDSNGNRLWSTYFGGDGYDYGNMLAINQAGSEIALVGGSSTTLTGVIATAGAHQQVHGGGSQFGDAFLAVFNINGVRLWSTYYGGSGDEWVIACDIDNAGDIYMAGGTNSSNGNSIATPGAHQTIFGGVNDAFIVKFSPTGTRLWATYYGGSAYDNGHGCTVDVSGNVYLCGAGVSLNGISTPGAFQSAFGGGTGWGDGFIAKFNALGVRQWGTYFGGSGDDYIYNAVVNSAGDLIIGGTTYSQNSSSVIATPGSYQPLFGGGASDAFILKMNPNGSRIWSTFFGGPAVEDYSWVHNDMNDHIFLSGSTNSSITIATACAYQQNFAGGVKDAYLERFDSNCNRLWGTYYGGSGIEEWATCTTDNMGNLFIVGRTTPQTVPVFTTSGCHQQVFGGGSWDGFIAKFDGCNAEAPINTTNQGSLTICHGKGTVLTATANCSLRWYATPTSTLPIGFGNSFVTPSLSNTTTFYVQESSCGNTATRTAVTVTVLPVPDFSIHATNTIVCAGNAATLIPQSAIGYTWVSNPTLNTLSPSLAIATPVNTQTYYLTAFDGICTGTSSVEIQVIQNPTLQILSPLVYLCSGNSTSLIASGATSYTWSPAVGLNTLYSSTVVGTPNFNTTYSVIGTNSSGNITCSSKQETVTVFVVPYANATVSSSVQICEGEEAVLTADGGNIYTWDPITTISDPNAKTVIVKPSESTIYTVSVSTNGFCAGTATVFVKVDPIPFIDAGIDTVYNINEPMFIAAIGSGTISWIDGSNIICTSCNVTQVFPENKSCYVAQAINDFGCSAQDVVCIDVKKDYAIFIPNSFTPNGDGLNDEFKVYGNGILSIELAVYDRWGQEIYITKDADKGWDGTFKQMICEEGLYTYKLSYKSLEGRVVKKAGHILLLKN